MATSESALLPSTKNLADRKCIGILGTGDFARALSKRLIFSGYDVIMGSRTPSARQLSLFDECLCGVQMTSLNDCISQCHVLVAAIHMENFKTTLASRADQLAGKVVIDVSNRTNRYSAVSNAEFLQSLVPAATVVKAFNSVSAFAMEDQTTVASNRVFVCCDDQVVRERVMDLARDLGFAPCDMGGLKAARSMEAFVLKVFPGWKVPLFFAFGVFNLWALYCIYTYFIEKSAYRWDQVFLKVFNKPLCMTAITILALTYLPGSIAGIVQLYRGTKYSRFPRWLNAWLISRRQMGLISLTLALMHAMSSVMMLSPTYYSSWFQQPSVVIPANVTGEVTLSLQPAWMVWKGELACLCGMIALVLLVMVGIASLPSVSASLNWAEWRLIQSRVGVFALALSVAHVFVMGAPGWVNGGWETTFRSVTFLSGFIPALTILLRIVLAIPPISRRLKKIRRGWERDSSNANKFSSGSSLETEESCASRKSNLKSSCSSGPAGAKGLCLTSKNPVYTAISLDGEAEDGCAYCPNGHAQASLPTRSCNCSAV